MVNGLNFPAPEELIAQSKQRKLSQLELLILKSRSFAIPIFLLGKSKGDSEMDKKEEIQNLYIDLRELDTIEDCTLPLKKRLELIDDLSYVFSQTSMRNSSEPIEDLRKKLGDITDKLKTGVKYNDVVDEEELAFVEQFGYGESLTTLHGFRQDVKKIIAYCLSNMGIGMKEFLKRGKISKSSELKEYCSYVAGSVGIALTNIVKEIDGRQLNPDHAKVFGEYLQMVNIIKNTREDYEKRGISFIPEEIHPGIGTSDLMEGNDKKARTNRSETLEKIIFNVESNFETSINYINSIPEELSGYRSFCLIPLITAEKTLQTMKNAGAEAVFKGEKKAIKIDREAFEKIYIFTERIAGIGAGAQARSWGMEYKEDPKKFSFIPGEYEKWAYNWLK